MKAFMWATDQIYLFCFVLSCPDGRSNFRFKWSHRDTRAWHLGLLLQLLKAAGQVVEVDVV